MNPFDLKTRLKNSSGATLVLVTISMVVLIAFVALAIDVGHLFVVRAQLQNAADAGALWGAQNLYDEYGTSIDTGANYMAEEAAKDNTALAKGGAIAVDIHDIDDYAAAGQRDGCGGDVDCLNQVIDDIQRGHWTFNGGGGGTFTANPSTDVVELWDVSTEELNQNPDFINAVRVVARRGIESDPGFGTSVASYFARILGFEEFFLKAEAVGYIGFAGTLTPGDIDQPIAICKQSLVDEDGNFSCKVGRMINSGSNTGTNQTGGWTDFNQDNPCSGGTNSNEVRDLVCAEGNPATVFLGGDIATNGGEIQTAFDTLEDCWLANTNKTVPWNLTLPVIDCDSNNVGTCEEVVGAVNLNVLWVLRDANKIETDSPLQMTAPGKDPWTCGTNCGATEADGIARWNSFVTHFDLLNSAGVPAEYSEDPQVSGFTKKTIYFLPDCTEHELEGRTGGENFGVLARIPVLVQ